MHASPTCPDVLTIGHVTQDLHADGSLSLGGTTTFAALTAQRLALTAAIVTSASPSLLAELPTLLPNIALSTHPSGATTTFANRYTQGFRHQYLLARSDALEATHVPSAWQSAPIVLIAPLAQELSPTIFSIFPRRPNTLIAATPQGWLRRWDADGRVWPTPWQAAEQVLPLLDALILSRDDLLPFSHGDPDTTTRLLTHWSTLVPLLVATNGAQGADLFQQGQIQHFPAYPAHEVDPTGAGDVFAAAFLIHLYHHHNAADAVTFANCAASLSIEHIGTSHLPTLAMIAERLHATMERKIPVAFSASRTIVDPDMLETD